MAIFLLFIFLFFAAIVSLMCTINSNHTKSTQLSQLRSENARAITNWQQKRKENFSAWINGMKNQYGEIETIIPIIPSEPQKTVIIFKEKQAIYFSSSWLKFKDINSSQIVDNPKTKAGKVISVTEKDLWNEIKRSSMQRTFGKTTGTWLAGPEKYTTAYQKEPDKIYHNYSVLISTLDILHPLFEISVGEDEHTAHLINATINVIITNQHGK